MVYQLIKVLYRIIIEDKVFEKEILVEKIPTENTRVFLEGYAFYVFGETQNLAAYVEHRYKEVACNAVHLIPNPDRYNEEDLQQIMAALRALSNGSAWKESLCSESEIVLVQQVEILYREPTPGEILGSSRFMSGLVGFILGGIAVAIVLHFLQ